MKTKSILPGCRWWVVAGSILTVTALHGLAAAGLKPSTLRCEYLANPRAVGTTQPRLSWVVEAEPGQRGVQQAAYQVLVASRPELLTQNQGDLWDSGKVSSDQSVHVVYAGKPLASGQACFWKVRLWEPGRPASAWSEPARWTMGSAQTGRLAGQVDRTRPGR